MNIVVHIEKTQCNSFMIYVACNRMLYAVYCSFSSAGLMMTCYMVG